MLGTQQKNPKEEYPGLPKLYCKDTNAKRTTLVPGTPPAYDERGPSVDQEIRLE